ncbi:MAG: hypothetical protein AB1410_01370 [Acidobacteriota bacterium]
MKKGSLLIILCIILLLGFSPSRNFFQRQEHGAQPIEIAEVLKICAVYCDKLENASLNFVCLEEITEKVNLSRDVRLNYHYSSGWTRSLMSIQTKIKNTYVYDLQFVRKNSQIKEVRILLEENGKKKNEKDASLKTISFLFKNVLFGPVGILSQKWQPYFEYKLVGEDKVNDEPAVILDVIPKARFKRDFLFGKVWLNKNDFSILKIEWNPQGMRNYVIFESLGLKYKSEPQITLISEFNIKKNNIRFPSKLFIEEAYVDKAGKKFVRSETNVIYKDYKFFTVTVEVEVKQ